MLLRRRIGVWFYSDKNLRSSKRSRGGETLSWNSVYVGEAAHRLLFFPIIFRKMGATRLKKADYSSIGFVYDLAVDTLAETRSRDQH
jgi:hypothetical protein